MEVFKGISRKFHPDWEGWKIIDDLIEAGEKPEENEELQDIVKEFYLNNEIDPIEAIRRIVST